MLIRLLVLLFCLTGAVLGDSWLIPEFYNVPTRSAVRVWSRKPLGDGRVLILGETRAMPRGNALIQLNRGQRPLWRVETRFRDNAPGRVELDSPTQHELRYEAHNSKLLVLRCFIKRRTTRDNGDMSFALNLATGALAWVGEPTASTTDHPGGPNLLRGDRLYETYVSELWTPMIVSRRVSDGRPLFMWAVPDRQGEANDLMNRRVQKLQPRSDGLLVSVADRSRHWETYLLSLVDGTLKSRTEGTAAPGEPLWR
jgi:hypothetical protein